MGLLVAIIFILLMCDVYGVLKRLLYQDLNLVEKAACKR
jgi:hypothetical protein